MTEEHLPECPMSTKDTICCSIACTCIALRACEERVSRAFHVVRTDDTKQWERFARDQFDAGYAAGYGAAMDDGWGEPGHIKEALSAALDASREAVSAALSHEDHCKGQIRKICNCSRFDALAAIDALKEKS